MGRALGVWCKNDEVMLALAEDGTLLQDSHERLQAPALFEQTEGLRAVLDAITRVLVEGPPCCAGPPSSTRQVNLDGVSPGGLDRAGRGRRQVNPGGSRVVYGGNA
jgi:hypothetical protein